MAYLDREMEHYLRSGASVEMRDASGNLAGVGFVFFWTRDEGYQIIEANVRDWHNTAAEIAHEQSAKATEEVRVYPQLVWRDYQFLHLYNLGQQQLRLSGKEFMIWFGCLHIAEKHRLVVSVRYFIEMGREQHLQIVLFFFDCLASIKSTYHSVV